MTNIDSLAYDPAEAPALYDGVLTRRVFAFFIDVIVIGSLVIGGYFVVAVFGALTLSLGWFLFPAVFPLMSLGYSAVTIGGRHHATLGMRAVDLEVCLWDGSPPHPAIGALHALTFWISVGMLSPLVLLVGLFNRRNRLLHDIVLGVIVLRRQIQQI